MKLAVGLGLCLFPFLLGIVGCAGYTPLQRQAEPVPIAVLPIINQSDLPQILAPLSRNVHERLAHSANWDLAPRDRASAHLQLTVLSITREGIARDPQDTGRPLSFNQIVRLSAEWISDLPPPWGNEAIVEIESDQLIYAQPSLVDAESAAIAELADRLADKLIQQLDWAQPAR